MKKTDLEKFLEHGQYHQDRVIKKKCNCCELYFETLGDLLKKSSIESVARHGDRYLAYINCVCGSTLTYKTNDLLEEGEIFQMIYLSFAHKDIKRDDIVELISDSQTRNLHLGITGALIFIDGVFVQLLEGERNCVIKLFEKIKIDPRHYEIHIVTEGFTNKRVKPKSGMQLKFIEGNDFKTYNLVLSWNKYRTDFAKRLAHRDIVEKIFAEIEELLTA